MTQPNERNLEGGLKGRLTTLALRMCLVMTMERLWLVLWPFFLCLTLLICYILFDVVRAIPPHWHVILGGALALAAAVSLITAVVRLKIPSRKEALYRLERINGLQHQPLSGLIDAPHWQGRNRFAQALWINHLDRLSGALKSVRVPWPKLPFDLPDPYLVRPTLGLLLFMAFFQGGGSFSEKWQRATDLVLFANRDPIVLTLWVQPPQYLGLNEQKYQFSVGQVEAQAPIPLYQHSQLRLSISGEWAAPPNVRVGDEVSAMAVTSPVLHTLELSYINGDALNIDLADGTNLVNVAVDRRVDQAPTVELTGPIETKGRGYFTIGFRAHDDFGVSQIRAKIASLTPSSLPALQMDYALLSEPAQEVVGQWQGNFAKHPWAGQEVVLTPIVEDQGGNIVRGQAVRFTLPERQFKQAVARELIFLRAQLTDRDPALMRHVQERLFTYLQAPALLDHDFGVFLALNVAHDRLSFLREVAQLEPVREILWESAVKLEEGQSGYLRQRLAQMTQDLTRLLAQDGGNRQAEQMFDRLLQDLQDMMQKMAQMTPPLPDLSDFGGANDAHAVDHDQLRRLLEKSRDLMRNGQTEAALAMLQQFQDILQRLAQQPMPSPEEISADQEIVEKLRALEADQQALMETTFHRAQTMPSHLPEFVKKAIEESVSQTNLSKWLHEQIRGLQKRGLKMGSALHEAQKAMEAAAQDLAEGRDREAINQQAIAFDKLQQGIGESLEQIAQKWGQSPTGGPQGPLQYDPLGRGNIGHLTGEENWQIPTDAASKRSRTIQRELQKRANETTRPEQELKYIRRLLDQF